MNGYNAKNYTEQGGDVTHIGGTLRFDEGARVSGFPGAENMEPVTGSQVKDVKDAFNALILNLKNSGIMVGDAWNVAVKAASSIPIADTADNSSHATVSIADNVISIALDKKVSELKDSNHGETWGIHKWIGFGVDSGLDSVAGIVFNDGTAEVTLTEDDATEATNAGLSAGDFILYIKAEKILAQGGSFTLKGCGCAETEFTLQITEPED